ncbi:MAG: class I SAM-dependent methyltransferase [Xanthomonadales bacterium]|nr:class I SAM-dependent methyltransferase [Xanthomonadales bacterium]
MSRKTLNLDDRLYQYLLDHSIRETDVQRELREETGKLEQAQMQIAPEQGQFMALLVRLLDVRNAIEIGVFTGYSGLCIASALREGGRLVACDVSEEWTRIARRYWDRAGVADRIDLRLAPALETIDDLLGQGHADRFDFAFIDADKENYGAYYDGCLQLLRTGGLIVFDNTLWSGRVADPAENDPDTVALRELNERLLGDERIDLSLVPIADGVTLARKR